MTPYHILFLVLCFLRCVVLASYPPAGVTSYSSAAGTSYPPARGMSYAPASSPPQRYGQVKKSEKFMPAEHGETPTCVKDARLTFCTDPDDYPRDRIRYLLEQNMFDISSVLMDETRDTYTFEAMDPPSLYEPPHGYLPPPPMVGYSNASSAYVDPKAYRHRSTKTSNAGMRYRRQVVSDEGDTMDLCPSRANYIMPKAAQSISGDWMFLVNLEENPRYTQLVRSETCLRNQCSGACQVPPGAVAVCQQQFAQKRLVALDGTGEQLSQNIFWFPSCCVCKIRR
ncbi:protein spaetzle 5 isoform X2 [Hyalella azteca]|uniref:Protein spaetzle 5 isoform X2 n=1 Tax=Hyalella azteca TaxID=294128 RepID=A0A8B7PRN3_HYAAZ|nr:protein spaetzle 5 isoform X2 [Hyalella azteca]